MISRNFRSFPVRGLWCPWVTLFLRELCLPAENSLNYSVSFSHYLLVDTITNTTEKLILFDESGPSFALHQRQPPDSYTSSNLIT
jgi:hypothetical protein